MRARSPRTTTCPTPVREASIEGMRRGSRQMERGTVPTSAAERVLDALDLQRAVDLVQQVCRIPSVLGEEGALASFLASTMRDAGFEGVDLQPVIEDRPNAVGHVSFRDGPTVVLTGHMD